MAEDLFQDTWVKLARNAHRLDEDTDLGAWLFRVARNAWVTSLSICARAGPASTSNRSSPGRRTSAATSRSTRRTSCRGRIPVGREVLRRVVRR